MSTENNDTTTNTRKERSSTMYSVEQSQQAVPANVQREVYKQFELLLLKKRSSNGEKFTVRQGLLVSAPQIEQVSSMTVAQVTHQIDVVSNVLVKMACGTNLHTVLEVLIKMCDSYLDDPHNMLSNDKKGKPDLPSYSKDDIESDVEIVIPFASGDNLSGIFLKDEQLRLQQQQQQLQHGDQSTTSTPQSSSSSLSSPALNSMSTPNSSAMNMPSSNSLGLTPPPINNLNTSSGGTDTYTPSITMIIKQQETVIQPLNAYNTYKYVTEDSPLHQILNTMHMILLSHLNNTKVSQGPSIGGDRHDAYPQDFSQSDVERSQITAISPKAIAFFFNLIQYTFTPAVRYKSARCLQVISVCSLDLIAQLFITRLQSGGKSDDFYREYSSMQLAAKYLEFGFQRQQQADGTNQYFAKLLMEMEKASRTVLMQSMLHTIVQALPRIFCGITHQYPIPDSFRSVIGKMYDVVLKWSKKNTKLKNLCIRALVALCGSSEEMVQSKGADLLNMIVKGVGEGGSKTRRSLLESFILYFKSLKSLYGVEAKASSFYQQHVDIVVPAILPKKGSPASDPVLVLEVLLTMGRFSPSISVSKHLLAILSPTHGSKSSEHGLEGKAVILKFLATLNDELGEQMRVYDRTIWQTLDPLFQSYEGDSSPLRYILLCFPALCSPEHRKDVGDRITRWTWSSDMEVATMSTLGITKYLALQPQTTFPPILFQMLNYITNFFGELVSLLKVVRNICMVMEEFIVLHHLPNGARKMSANIDASTWRNLRETCEGVALYLLNAPAAPALWNAVLNLVRLTGHPLFRDIDNSSDQTTLPYLADHLLPTSSSPLASIAPHMNSDLVNFLINHEGPLQNSINWAWTRLRKRWHPKSQPGLPWRNNLAFLLLSLRLNTDSPEVTAVEDQLLTEVLTCYFQEREGKTAEELGPVIAEISLFLHRSCYDTVFRFLEQERGRDLKRKRKEVFYTQEYVIVYISQLMVRLTVADYDNIPSVRAALREVTYFWITNPQIFQSLSPSIKNHIAKSFKHFLYLESKSSIPRGEISLNKASYCKLLFACLQSLSENTITTPDSIEGELELNLQKAFNIVVSVGCLDDFKKDIVPHLIRSLILGQHIHQTIAETLAGFLRRSPKYLNEYIDKSFDNEKSPTSSLSFLRALVICFTDYFLSWGHNCRPERLIHICLFHMVSNYPDARKLAIVLSNRLMMKTNAVESTGATIVGEEIGAALSIDDKGADMEELERKVMVLSSHLQIVPTNHASNFVYNRSSLLYSNSMASKYQWMTPGLFEEVDTCFHHLPFSHRLSMLTLLAPWTRNFYWMLSNSTGAGGTITASIANNFHHLETVLPPKSVENVLESLMNITLQSRESSSTHNALEVLWGELASSGDSANATTKVYKKVIEFLKEKYHQENHHAGGNQTSYHQQDVRQCCTMVMSFISRRSSSHWIVAMELMAKSLRHYPILPPSPSQFVGDFLGGSENESISLRSEEAYLYFLEDLAFEFQHQDVIQIPRFLPTLLVNALLVSVSRRLIENILMSLVIQQPTISDAIKKDAQYLIQQAPVNIHDWSEKERLILVKVMISSLGETIVEIWEQLMLQFGIRSNQQSSAIPALEWYQSIRTTLGTKKDGMDGLLGLCCGLWRACVMGDVEKMYKALEVLSGIVATAGQKCIQSETSYSIVVRLGSILLHTSYFSQFNASLVLLNRIVNSLESNPSLQSKIVEEMIDILGAGMRTETVVNRGIAHPHTSLLTLWFAKSCISFYDKHQRNALLDPIVSSVVIAAACMVAMAPEDPLTLDFFEYLSDSEKTCKSLSSLMSILHPYYPFITRTTTTAPYTPSELIKNLAGKLFSMYGHSPDLLSNIIRSVTEMVRSSMDSNKENDAAFYLMLIEEMLNNSNTNNQSAIYPQYLIEFVVVIIEVCQRSSSVQTREHAQNLLPFIMDNLPQGLQIGQFDYLKPFTNGFEQTSMFGFQTDADSLNNLYSSLYLINTYIFAVPADSPLNIQMRRSLENSYKDRLPSSHHLPSINQPYVLPNLKKHKSSVNLMQRMSVPIVTSPTSSPPSSSSLHHQLSTSNSSNVSNHSNHSNSSGVTSVSSVSSGGGGGGVSPSGPPIPPKRPQPPPPSMLKKTNSPNQFSYGSIPTTTAAANQTHRRVVSSNSSSSPSSNHPS